MFTSVPQRTSVRGKSDTPHKSHTYTSNIAHQHATVTSGFHLTDNRPSTVAQRKLHLDTNKTMGNISTPMQLMAKQQEGSDEYKRLAGEKKTADDQLAAVTARQIKKEKQRH